MTKSLIRLMVLIAFGSFIIIGALLSRNLDQSGKAWSGSLMANGILLVCVAALTTVALYYAVKKLVPFIDGNAQAQARFLDTLNPKYAGTAILFAAALSLFIELACIRWQRLIPLRPGALFVVA